MDKLNLNFQKTWDSGLKIITNPRVIIPAKILAVCQKIQEKIGYNEFSILVKGTWTEKGFRISENFVIPEQEVTATTIKYSNLQQYKQQGYNTVIHSHPFSGRFSSVDENSINAHFLCSVLFIENKFTKAIITVPVSNGIKLQVNGEIVVDFNIDVGNIEITNIKPVSKRNELSFLR